MEIKKIDDAPGYYAVDNGFVYVRKSSDNKLHKVTVHTVRRQHVVSIKINGKFKTISLGQIIAKAFLNAHGNFSVYRRNKTIESYKPSNLRVKYHAKPNMSHDNTPKKCEVRKFGTMQKMVFDSILKAARALDINDTQIRAVIDTPKDFSGYTFRSVIE